MEAKEVAPGVFAALGPEGTANAGFILGANGVLAIDTMMTPSMTRGMLAEIRKRTPQPVRLLVNTHYHGDHTFGNQFFPEAVIAAHQGVRKTMVERGEGLIAQMLRFRPELKDELKEVRITPPALVYPEGLVLYWDGMRVELSHPGRAHTDGDTLVYLPEKQVLFTGDLLFSRIFPALMPEGSSRGWIRTLARLARLPLTAVVPGHGPISGPANLQEFRRFLVRLRLEVKRCWQRGLSREDAVRQVRMEAYVSWERPERLAGAVGIVYDELARPG